MSSDQPPLFDEPPELAPQDPVEAKITSTDEVFNLAREHFGLSRHREGDTGNEDLPELLVRARARRVEEAAELGLVAKWADYKRAKGHIAIHSPATGEWCAVPWKAAPSWAQWEARKRSEVYKATGDAGAFNLTAAQMEELWKEEHSQAEPEEGIIEEHTDDLDD